jgi:hypothetical protein
MKYALFFLLISTTAHSFVVPFSDEPIQTEENKVSSFIRVGPPDSVPIPLDTDFWLWHDHDFLYVKSQSEIDEHFRQGSYTSRNDSPEADYLRIQVITGSNNDYSYMFYVYPLGNRHDAIRDKNHSTDSNWNSNYRYHSEINDGTWDVIMRIPFKDLRFFGTPPYDWKIILTRYVYHDSSTYSDKFLLGSMGRGYFRNAQDIIIAEEIFKSKNYLIRPYTVATYDIENEDIEYDMDNLGIDLAIDPNFYTKVKLSLNPDFSDVPMDSEQDVYNLRYPPTYRENRYFFTEDLNVFGTSSNLFYTRHIMQPQYALKVTANRPGYSYGFLSAWDKKIEEEGVIYNRDHIYNALAYNPRLGDLDLQFTLLNRMDSDFSYHNEVFLVRPVWDIDDENRLRMELNYSYLDDETTTSSGYYGEIGYDLNKQDFSLSLDLEKMSEDYTADMGNIYLTDYYAWTLSSEYTMNLQHDFLRSISSSFYAKSEIDNDTQQVLDKRNNFELSFRSHKYLELHLGYLLKNEFYQGSVFDNRRSSATLLSYHIDWLNLFLAYHDMNTLIYQLNDIYRGAYYQYGISGYLGRHFFYRFSADNVKYYGIKEHGFDDDYWIMNLNLRVNLSNQFSITGGGRYNNYESNNVSGRLGIFANIIWELYPGLSLYSGYKLSEDRINDKFESDYSNMYLKLTYSF